MLLSIIYHFLKTACGYAIKIIAWLLVSLSLWVPLIYTLIFVIVCGITGASLGELRSWFFAGLFVTFIGSFAVSTYIYERGLKRKKQQKITANIEKVREKSEDGKLKKAKAKEEVEDAEEAHEGEDILSLAKSESQLKRFYEEQEAAAEDAGSLDDIIKKKNSDISAKHGFYEYNALNNFTPDISASGGYDGDYRPEEKSFGGCDEYRNIFDAPVLSGDRFEKPKVFATRADPTVLIYEYADRLEYYKRTRAGLVLMQTRPRA